MRVLSTCTPYRALNAISKMPVDGQDRHQTKLPAEATKTASGRNFKTMDGDINNASVNVCGIDVNTQTPPLRHRGTLANIHHCNTNH